MSLEIVSESLMRNRPGSAMALLNVPGLEPVWRARLDGYKNSNSCGNVLISPERMRCLAVA